MAIIPSSTQFIGISSNVNLTEKKSSQINSETQPYTMQDIIDTAGGGGSPAGTAGQIQFSDGSAFAADSNLFWDNTNKYLGVGTSTPLYILDVRKTSGSLDAVFTNTDSTSSITFYQDNNQGRGLRLQTYGSTATGTLLDGTINRANSIVFRTNDNSYPMVFGGFSNSSEKIYFGKNNFTLALNTTTNNVTIGASSGSARLQVKGSGSTSATTSLLVQNSSGTELFKVTDDGIALMRRINYGSSASEGQLRFGDSFLVYNTSGTASLSSSSAGFEVQSTTKGFLPPRMTTTQKNAIASPASGLMVYDTSLNQMSYYNGSAWVNF
jgi:hypothetical protein